MSKKTVLILLLVAIPIVVLNSMMGKASKENPRNSNIIVLPIAKSVEEKINKHRVSIGLSALFHDDALCVFAQERADRMVDIDWVSTPHPYLEEDHKNSTVSGRYISENVGAGLNEDVVIEGWLNSKGHRSAVEDISHTATCVATNKTLIVQIFSQK